MKCEAPLQFRPQHRAVEYSSVVIGRSTIISGWAMDADSMGMDRAGDAWMRYVNALNHCFKEGVSLRVQYRWVRMFVNHCRRRGTADDMQVVNLFQDLICA